jgi:hypothetical protein
MANVANVALVGLPGSGKSRVLSSLLKHPWFITRPGQVREINGFGERAATESLALKAASFAQDGQVWCVLDVRKPLLAGRDEWVEQALLQLLSQAHGVVLTFLEDADLTQQAWWNHWLKRHVATLPVVRWLNQGFAERWAGFAPDTSANKVANKVITDALILPAPWQRFEFDLPRVCLEHLLMGLDASKTNLGMAIWRVQGVVNTLEYQNAIAIEGTPTQLRTYAAADVLQDAPSSEQVNEQASEQVKIGHLVIEGFGLDQAWLTQIVMASAG